MLLTRAAMPSYECGLNGCNGQRVLPYCGIEHMLPNVVAQVAAQRMLSALCCCRMPAASGFGGGHATRVA